MPEFRAMGCCCAYRGYNLRCGSGGDGAVPPKADGIRHDAEGEGKAARNRGRRVGAIRWVDGVTKAAAPTPKGFWTDGLNCEGESVRHVVLIQPDELNRKPGLEIGHIDRLGAEYAASVETRYECHREPPKLTGDVGSMRILCEFNGVFTTNRRADVGASVERQARGSAEEGGCDVARKVITASRCRPQAINEEHAVPADLKYLPVRNRRAAELREVAKIGIRILAAPPEKCNS